MTASWTLLLEWLQDRNRRENAKVGAQKAEPPAPPATRSLSAANKSCQNCLYHQPPVAFQLPAPKTAKLHAPLALADLIKSLPNYLYHQLPVACQLPAPILPNCLYHQLPVPYQLTAPIATKPPAPRAPVPYQSPAPTVTKLPVPSATSGLSANCTNSCQTACTSQLPVTRAKWTISCLYQELPVPWTAGTTRSVFLLVFGARYQHGQMPTPPSTCPSTQAPAS